MDTTSLVGDVGFGGLAAIITAVGALGAAAFSLVDATKAFNGGVSNVGLRGILTALHPFASALDRALGTGQWTDVIRSHWLNGRPREQQKAIVRSLIRLGLSPETARDLASAAHVQADALQSVAGKLESGAELGEIDLNVLGRLDASVEAQLDAAYDRADQRYRNVSRLFAGIVSVVLTLFATWALDSTAYAQGVVVGLLAVPLAPIAKDLASSLQAAAKAAKLVK